MLDDWESHTIAVGGMNLVMPRGECERLASLVMILSGMLCIGLFNIGVYA